MNPDHRGIPGPCFGEFCSHAADAAIQAYEQDQKAKADEAEAAKQAKEAEHLLTEAKMIMNDRICEHLKEKNFEGTDAEARHYAGRVIAELDLDCAGGHVTEQSGYSKKVYYIAKHGDE